MDATLFPFPHSIQGIREPGSVFDWPPVCVRCKDRPCESGPVGAPQLCPYGMNYWRVTPDFLVGGLVLQDWVYNSQARQKRLREKQNYGVSGEQLAKAVATFKRLTDEEEQARQEARAAAEDVVVDEEVFKAAYLAELKAEVLRGLSFVHDYKQINAQISQNINVVVETRYDGASFEDKLAKAMRAERAIYEAAKFLEEKLNVAKFLVHPEWLQLSSECRRFRVHGVVLKYARIYQSFFDSRGVRLSLKGDSRGEVIANPIAFGVVPHTLIDNALKYSPTGSTVEVFLQDEPEGVYLEVSSFGPRLEKKEFKKIFHPFYRGKEASRLVEEGAGYGLYISQLIAKQHLGTKIDVAQETKPGAPHRDMMWTTFSVMFPPKSPVCP